MTPDGPKLAVIAGTGVAEHLEVGRGRRVKTESGDATVRRGMGGGVLVLERHGSDHAIPPHMVNYRANILALKGLGVDRVVSTSAVGSMRAGFGPGEIGLASQFLDFTKGRPVSLYEGKVVHTDMTTPYSESLGRELVAASRSSGVRVHAGLVYVCVEGPRFETAAEIRMFKKLGGDVVGMTGVPEVVFAREAGLEYASLLISTNWAAGIQQKVSHQEVLEVMKGSGVRVKRIVEELLRLQEGK
jgi:5'-methylthioinosine phosphorylase